MTTLEQAIAGRAWPTALGLALEAWRRERTTELADQIDWLTERCTLPPPPHTRSALQRWWVARAVDPDPLMVGALLGTLGLRTYVADTPWETMYARWRGNPIIEAVAAIPPPLYRVRWAQQQGKPFVWERAVPNWVERAAAMYTWPDDPRVARALAQLVGNSYAWLDGEPCDGPWPLLADRLRALGDRRIGALLAPRPVYHHATSRQAQMLALRAEFPAESAPSTLLDPRAELAPLWHEVGEHPDDDAPRLVLADALLALGDNRGELIALQCSPDPARRGHALTQANRLIKREWDRWMGPLALLLAKRGTELRRGLLESIRVGRSETPPWLWEAVTGHHELVAVREVHPAMVHPQHYVPFVAALPRALRVLGVDAPEMIHGLVEHGARPALERVIYVADSSALNYRRQFPPFEVTMRALAQLAPRLVQLDLGVVRGGDDQPAEIHDQLPARLAFVRSLFPRLGKLRVAQRLIREERRPLIASLGIELYG